MTAAKMIDALPFWTERPVLTPIVGGRTNRNYMAEAQGRRYFVRQGHDIPHLGISREAERRAAGLAAAAGLAPAIRYVAEGVLITDFVEGTALDPATAATPASLGLIARHLRRLHRIPAATGLPLFCPVTISLDYLDRLGDGPFPLDAARLRRCLKDLPRAVARCLVHGDLIPENFIVTREGGLSLIDWEYAGNGEPEIDLALIASNFDLGDTQLDDFVVAYGDADRAAVAQFGIAAALREALWCQMQLHFGGDAGDLSAYARKCADRAQKLLT